MNYMSFRLEDGRVVQCPVTTLTAGSSYFAGVARSWEQGMRRDPLTFPGTDDQIVLLLVAFATDQALPAGTSVTEAVALLFLAEQVDMPPLKAVCWACIRTAPLEVIEACDIWDSLTAPGDVEYDDTASVLLNLLTRGLELPVESLPAEALVRLVRDDPRLSSVMLWPHVRRWLLYHRNDAAKDLVRKNTVCWAAVPLARLRADLATEAVSGAPPSSGSLWGMVQVATHAAEDARDTFNRLGDSAAQGLQQRRARCAALVAYEYAKRRRMGDGPRTRVLVSVDSYKTSKIKRCLPGGTWERLPWPSWVIDHSRRPIEAESRSWIDLSDFEHVDFWASYGNAVVVFGVSDKELGGRNYAQLPGDHSLRLITGLTDPPGTPGTPGPIVHCLPEPGFFPRHSPAVALLDHRVYVVGGHSMYGSDGGATAEAYTFDLRTCVWTTLPPMPRAIRGAQAVAGSNELWVVGGVARNQEWTGQILSYDDRRHWRVRGQLLMPQPENAWQSPLRLRYERGLLCVTGGRRSDERVDVECFDTTAEVLVTAPAPPTAATGSEPSRRKSPVLMV